MIAKVFRAASLFGSGAALGATAMVILVGYWIDNNIRYYA